VPWAALLQLRQQWRSHQLLRVLRMQHASVPRTVSSFVLPLLVLLVVVMSLIKLQPQLQP
jgi:hypothetical protein